MKLKKFKLLSVFIIFLLSFITHNIYDWIPNIITSFFFPVNESIFEHMKMILTTYLIYSIIEYIYLKKKNIKTLNIKSNLLLSITFNIIIFLIIYLPYYNIFGHNLISTLIIYFISILLTQLLSLKLLSSNKELFFFNKYAFVIIIIYILSFIYLTYYPLDNYIFIDKTKNKAGINNYY